MSNTTKQAYMQATFDHWRETLKSDNGLEGQNVFVGSNHIGSYGGPYNPNNVVEQRAALIAAAPDLLKVANLAREFIENIQANDILTEHEQSLLTLAMSAIAKAGG